MQIDNIMMLVIIGSFFLYLGLGALYTQMLLAQSSWFSKHGRNNDLLCTLSTLIWPVIFVAFITWRMVEVLFESREKDWQD